MGGRFRSMSEAPLLAFATQHEQRQGGSHERKQRQSPRQLRETFTGAPLALTRRIVAQIIVVAQEIHSQPQIGAGFGDGGERCIRR